MVAPIVDPYLRAAVIRRWVDADTVAVDIDLGMNAWAHGVRLRLQDVWAVELSQAGGVEARDKAARYWPAGTPCIVQTFKAAPDTFTRYLARIWVEGVEVGPEIVRLGMATATP